MHVVFDVTNEFWERCVFKDSPVTFEVALPSYLVEFFEARYIRFLIEAWVVLDLGRNEEWASRVWVPVYGVPPGLLAPRILSGTWESSLPFLSAFFVRRRRLNM